MMPQLFGDALLASAAMDRLLHGAHVLILDGDSYRNPPSERRRRANEKNTNQEIQS
jgi:DNA replication protein DnaC